MASIQGIYIALFGRPADPVGLAFWTEATKGGQDLSALTAMTQTPEYLNRFAGKTPEEIVTSIYQGLFGRAPDARGLEFFTDALENGSLDTIAIQILDGAQGSDAIIIDNKETAADLFTASLDTPEEIAAYSGVNAIANAQNLLNEVTDDPSSIPTAQDIDAAIQTLDEPPAPQDEEEEAPPVGGGGSGGDPTPPAFTNSYGNLVQGDSVGKLFVGSGNPSNGFLLSNNASQGIELGLDVRYTRDPSEVLPSAGNTFVIDTSKAGAVRFAYSVAEEGGIDLAAHSYKLLIDADPTAAVNYLSFTLAADSDGAGSSSFDWVLDGGAAKIGDDGGNDSVTQNIEAFQFFNGGRFIEAGDNYSVVLRATDNSTGATLAESSLNVKTGLETQIESESFVVANVGGIPKELYVGNGNSAEGFATTTLSSSGLVLGLAAKTRGGPNIGPSTDEFGTVHYQQVAGDFNRFVYSVQSLDNDKLSNYVIKLKVDTDASNNESFVEFVLKQGANDGSGPNGPDGLRDSVYGWSIGQQVVIKDDGGDGAAGKITQNTQNIAWYDASAGSVLGAGEYEVILEAYKADGVSLIGQQKVIFDVLPALAPL